MQSFQIEDDSMVEAWRRLTHTMAISTFLRGTPYYMKNGKSYFPQDLCKKYELPAIERCDIKAENVKSIVRDMTNYALDNYEEVRKLWKQGCRGDNKQFERMILLGTPSVFYLEQLKKRKFDLVGTYQIKQVELIS